MFENIRQPKKDVLKHRSVLVDTNVGTLDVLGATFEETLYYNPVSALNRYLEIQLSKTAIYNNQRLAPKDWEISEYYRPGIEVGQEGITEGEAALLAENYDRRESIRIKLDRANGGFAEGVAQFGVGLAGSVLDPLNIAASFIPTVGVAKFAHLVAKNGFTKARKIMKHKKRYVDEEYLKQAPLTKAQMFGRGAVEGVTGAIAVEPIILLAADAEQDRDYTIVDSLMNVALGSALGGGLHVFAGSLSNRLRRAKEETRRTMLQVAVSQRADGRNVDVEDIALTDPKLREEPSKPISPERKRVVDEVQDGEPVVETKVTVDDKKEAPKNLIFTGKITRILNPNNKNRPKSLSQWVRANAKIRTDTARGDVQQIFDKREAFGLLKDDGMPIDDVALAAQEAGYFPNKSGASAERVTLREFLDALEEDQMTGRVFSVFDDDKVDALEQAEQILHEATELGVDPYNKTDEQLFEDMRRAQEEMGLGVPAKDPVEDGLTKEEFDRMVDRSYANYEGLGELDTFEPALREADEIDRTYSDPELESVTQEINDLDAQVRGMTEFDKLPEEFVNGINQADELIERADAFDMAARAGAACFNRRMGK